MRPGEVVSAPGSIEVNAGLNAIMVTVRSTSRRPVRVSSHYPFWRANARLEFDRTAAAGRRLDIMAGDTVRWAPGETKVVSLVRIAGELPNEETT